MIIIGERGRQAIHAAAGLAFIPILLAFGREALMGLVFGLLIFGSLLINMRLTGSKSFVIRWIEDSYERRESRFPGWGPAWYLAGVLLIVVFLKDPMEIAASIYVLAIGDSVSTLVGVPYGRNAIPFTRKKSVEGTLAFMASCLPLYALISYSVVPLALVTALVEAYSVNVEDNLTVPLACVVMFSLFI